MSLVFRHLRKVSCGLARVTVDAPHPSSKLDGSFAEGVSLRGEVVGFIDKELDALAA
jgi:hypothetical protein